MTPAFSSEQCPAAAASGQASPLRICYAMEAAVAAVALIVLLPVLLAIAVALYVISGKGPLITHARVGRYGRPFGMLKFRTMWRAGSAGSPFFHVEAVSGKAPPHRKGRVDERVTSRFAAFCRKYSLDELPQLYHVVRGEMSLVGPRPLTVEELDTHYGADSPEVLQLRPGLTGLWQVMGRDRLSYAQRRRLDLLLARRASAGLYLRILILSIPKVVSGSGAS